MRAGAGGSAREAGSQRRLRTCAAGARARIGPPPERIVACSMTLASSRTLPGQSCSCRTSIASGVSVALGARPPRTNRRSRWRARSGMSPVRSRSGGRRISKVLMRNYRSSRNSSSAIIVAQVAVGGAQHPHVDAERLGLAHAADLAAIPGTAAA